MIKVEENQIYVDTRTLKATFDAGVLVSLARKRDGRAFIQKAQSLGFRVMPHCNSIDMDPTHPVYASVRDFQYRSLDNKRVQGWTWHKGRVKPVPESNSARLRHRDKKTMVKIHPGLGMWRSILTENVRSAVESLSLDLVFLDVTTAWWTAQRPQKA